MNGFADVFADIQSCLAECQKPFSTKEEFEENDGDLASNLGELIGWIDERNKMLLFAENVLWRQTIIMNMVH